MTDDAVAPERSLVTSSDGQWAAAREGSIVVLLPGSGGAALGTIELPTGNVDIALVGPPTVLVVLAREPEGGSLTLYTVPELEAAVRLDLDAPGRLAAITGPRLAVLSPDARHVAVVRCAARALAPHKLEIAGTIEFVVGLERNQLLFGLPRKLEVWDAVSGRPALRPQFQLPPPPRMLGAAAGHLWAATTGSPDVFLYRLSDGRPFRHDAGAPIVDVICHPASPILVLVTATGLLRLHAYAHSLTRIDHVPEPAGALAQHVIGDDISIVGFTSLRTEPWRIPINGAGVATVPSPQPAPAPSTTAAPAVAAPAAPPASAPIRAAAPARWRDPLATFARDLVNGFDAEPPALAADTELGELAHRLGLGAAAHRALVALYGAYLVGEPALPIAALARMVDDWSEALGQGELGALAMLRRKHGKVALRTAVTDHLDGAPPRSIRLVGDGATTSCAGAFRVSRDSRSDAEIESALVAELGHIAMVEGPLPAALLEARLHGATAVALAIPAERPRPWPHNAGLVLVLYGTASSWVADLPTLVTTP